MGLSDCLTGTLTHLGIFSERMKHSNLKHRGKLGVVWLKSRRGDRSNQISIEDLTETEQNAIETSQK